MIKRVDENYLDHCSFAVHEVQNNLLAESLGTFATFLVICLSICAILFGSFFYRSKDLPSIKERDRIRKSLIEDGIDVIEAQSVNNEDRVDGGREQHCATFVSELSTNSVNHRTLNKARAMFQSNDMYIWLVIMMGVSYSIPALQLVLKYQDSTEETGNMDICYFNFQCAFPLGRLSDFNHFLSNIGYVAFGITFIVITKYKSWRYHTNRLNNVIRVNDGYYLIPKVLLI